MTGMTRNQAEQAILDQADQEVRSRFSILCRDFQNLDDAVQRFTAGVQKVNETATAAIKAISDINFGESS